ncbi:MAG TPA: L-aspartate oxidase [Terriglobales bacterium]|jgi:L-aspartate oxidase
MDTPLPPARGAGAATDTVTDYVADFVIVGAGIAGLRAALELGAAARTPIKIVVLTKEALAESATQYAQGGIAVAMGEDDTVALHERDTLVAGDGLCSPRAVHTLVEEGPHAIAELLAWGADFDHSGERLERTREAAHSRSRILHAHGDSTGREIAETLARRVEALPGIEWRPHGRATRLLLDAARGRVLGIEYRNGNGGHATRHRLWCRAVLLATGGLGQLYAATTNPGVATGDGPALAYQAGAELADMEFVQFHPTALALEGAPHFLLTESLRGEGAILRNPAGEPFMSRYHPAAELAPRDVVARALEAELRTSSLSGGPPAAVCYLDATRLPAAQLEHRFPRIAATLAAYGLNLARDPIPVRPAAHYAMGGIATDLEGRSTLPGLYAAGECACTGVHGANRLASNSLLEGLVFGARAGRAMAADTAPAPQAGTQPALENPAVENTPADLDAIQHLLSAGAGVMRSGPGLETAAAALARLPAHLSAIAAAAIVRAALARHESRGAHFRDDFPRPDPSLAGQHSFQRRRAAVRFAALN